MQVKWHSADPEDEDMPDEGITVLTCISGDDGTVTYDHAFVLAEWYWDGEEWDFRDQIAEGMKNVVVHGWMPLPEWEESI